MNKSTRIEISPRSIIFAVLFIVGLVVAWKIRQVLIALFIAFILMSGFSPLVDELEKRGIRKIIAVIITYLLAIAALATLLFIVIPPFVEQTRVFINKLPAYIETLQLTLNQNSFPVFSGDDITRLVSSRLDDALSNILTVFLNVFSVIVSFVTIAVFTFYLLLERNRIKENLHLVFPHWKKKRVYDLAHKIEVKLGAWVRGEVSLMFIVGTLTYVGLSILRIDFALPLAVLAGLLEIVPMLGPTIAAVPAVIIAFTQGPILVIPVVALYVLIQQLENNLIVPKVMEKAVGVSPIVIILALLVGGTLFGIIGGLLAVPATAIAQVIISDYFENTPNAKGLDLDFSEEHDKA